MFKIFKKEDNSHSVSRSRHRWIPSFVLCLEMRAVKNKTSAEEISLNLFIMHFIISSSLDSKQKVIYISMQVGSL